MSQLYCVLDFETYSEADLKKVGAWEYATHPSTEILCLAYRIGTRETLKKVQTTVCHPDMISNEFRGAMRDPNTTMVAHNALFEQVIIRHVLNESIEPRRWICTAGLAAALALPRNLEGAAKVLGLPAQKDMEGNRLIKKWCKPRKPTLNNPSTRHTDPDELRRIMAYCATDVDTTVELFLRLPQLTPLEREVWLLDQKINQYGFEVDRLLVESALAMISEESKNLDRETKELTHGVLSSAQQRDRVIRWLDLQGCPLPNLQKKTVEDRLAAGDLSDDARRMLEIRLAVSKTSTAKYQSYEMRSRSDGRVRDILMYHGASTGRWAGTGVNPQNLPRPTIKNTDQAAEIIKDGDLEMLRLIYGDPMSALSSCLRSAIVAPPGTVLDVADYAAIEARVLFWVARHEDGLNAFRENRDLYVELARNIFSVRTVSSSQRFLGKTATLGCGFGMGPKKFLATCANYGVVINEGLADDAVKTYRSVHSPVVRLWDITGRAAIAACETVGKSYTVNRMTWFVKGQFLYCQLPSGRRLAYFGPSIRYEPTLWGGKRPTLYHWSVDPITRKWVNSKTYGGRLVENVVQAISRDLMAEAMLRIEAAGPWRIVLSVHDELIAERGIARGDDTGEFCRLMGVLPDWAEGLPVKVEGWSGKRYRK